MDLRDLIKDLEEIKEQNIELQKQKGKFKKLEKYFKWTAIAFAVFAFFAIAFAIYVFYYLEKGV